MVLFLGSDWLSHVPSHCKILCKHTAVTTSQEYNCANQTSCFRMSDFVINFDLLGGLSLDEWLNETDRMKEEEIKERRHTEINERDTEELEKSTNEARIIKQMLWSVRYF